MRAFALILLNLIIFSQFALAQKGKIIKLDSGVSYNFMVDGEEITGKKAKKMISIDPEALYSFESARQNRTVSHVFTGLGVAGLIYSTAAFINEDMDTKWGIFAGSVVLVGFAIPLYISAEKQMCGALEKYNSRFMDPSTSYRSKRKANFQLLLSGQHAGLAINF